MNTFIYLLYFIVIWAAGTIFSRNLGAGLSSLMFTLALLYYMIKSDQGLTTQR